MKPTNGSGGDARGDMNGLQQARVAAIAAGSVALVAGGPAPPESAFALLGAVAGLVLLLLPRGGAERAPVLLTGSSDRSRRISPSPLFLREQRAQDESAEDRDPLSRNGRRQAQDETQEPIEGAPHSSALSYEEFTARVEEEADSEEISFLPPYASGAGKTAQAETGAASDPWDIEGVDDPEEREAGSQSKMPMPRHFALGTVAVIRKLLEPEEVERILAEQRRYPRLRFGDIAVQLGLLSEAQLQELLLAQQQGVFTDAEICDARDRLKSFRDRTGAAGKR